MNNLILLIALFIAGTIIWFRLYYRIEERVHKELHGLSTKEAKELFIKVEPEIQKLLRPGWEILECAWNSINKYTACFSIYVFVINPGMKERTDRFVYFDNKGKITSEYLTENIGEVFKCYSGGVDE